MQERVNIAYEISGGDIDFIGTIGAESMYDPDASGDYGRSYGYCQINDRWHWELQDKYRSLSTDREKLELCLEMYRGYEERGILHKRLYGYNSRLNGIAKLEIVCK